MSKCYATARRLGFPGFALNGGGYCSASKDMFDRPHINGTRCNYDGMGGNTDMQVYKFICKID